MELSFAETVDQDILDDIQSEIQDELFQQWSDSHLDEGIEYAEYRFFQFANSPIKELYNKFYGYKEGDEYYLS